MDNNGRRKTENRNDWEYNFISDILKKKEEDEKHKLTKKQFKKLAELHEKYRPYALSCFYKS